MHIAHIILSNPVITVVITLLVSTVFVILKLADRCFHLNTRHNLVRFMHNLSRDDLSIIRKSQIRFLFRYRYGLYDVRISLAGGSYWMSIPCVITGTDRATGKEKKFMGKIINERSALKHKYMTQFRNLGVMADGAMFAFDGHSDARDMVEYERDSLIRLRNRGVAVPGVYGLHKLNFEDYILVMEYIDGMPLSKVTINGPVIDQVFLTLKIMHDNGVFHGDIKLDNFLLLDGRIAVVDCLKIDNNVLHRAQDFDLICAICALAQKAPAGLVVDLAKKYHTDEELRRSVQLIGIALNKVDLELPTETIKEIVNRLS